MATGPGRYDDLCTYVREQAEAKGAILIIIGGNKGEGFECQLDNLTMARMPELLEGIAAQIRKDMEGMGHG
jgi:methylmalonyl-CoA mutase cobalamin-binding subunit